MSKTVDKNSDSDKKDKASDNEQDVAPKAIPVTTGI